LFLAGEIQAQFNQEALGNWFIGLNPENVEYAVNCGSIDTVTDMVGVTYMADDKF